MENLTKENFWNEMEVKYPESMRKFHTWIDNYKEENNWDKLFNSNIHGDNNPSYPRVSNCPKFHELPLAMQMGIMYQFYASSRIRQEKELFDRDCFEQGKKVIEDIIRSVTLITANSN